MTICNGLGFSNMTVVPDWQTEMERIANDPSLSDSEKDRRIASLLESVEATAPDREVDVTVAGKKPFPWWLLILTAAGIYYSQKG